jgi:hypothetical protein
VGRCNLLRVWEAGLREGGGARRDGKRRGGFGWPDMAGKFLPLRFYKDN